MGFFGKYEDVVIPWKNIIKIGEDVILVRYKDISEIKVMRMKSNLLFYWEGLVFCDKIKKILPQKWELLPIENKG